MEHWHSKLPPVVVVKLDIRRKEDQRRHMMQRISEKADIIYPKSYVDIQIEDVVNDPIKKTDLNYSIPFVRLKWVCICRKGEISRTEKAIYEEIR